MSTMLTPEYRRKLGRKFRRGVVFFWVLAGFIGVIALGIVVGDGEPGNRDDVHPSVVVAALTLLAALFVYALVTVQRQAGLWRKASGAAPVATLQGSIVSIRHTRVGSAVKSDMGGAEPYTFFTRDYNDRRSVPAPVHP